MKTIESKINKANLVFHIIFLITCIIFILPLAAIISISISNDTEMVKFGYSLIPKTVDFSAYQYIFRGNERNVILMSYGVTILITAVGSALGLLLTSMIAYPLSRKDFKFRNHISLYVYITMLFSGGLVPTYLVITRLLQMNNTVFALIVPGLISAFNIIIIRTYFQTIPMALIESSKIDGATEIRIFLQIILPLSKPCLATIGLFLALNYWNNWFSALLYLSPSKSYLYPLQYLLYIIMENIAMLTKNSNIDYSHVNISDLPTESARMAMCVVAAGPMLFVFAFFQKYFVKGLTLGSIKG